MLPKDEPTERGGMSKLTTLVDTKGDAFAENAEAFGVLMEELRERSAEARRGGGEKAQRRHRERGKLPVRTGSNSSSTPERPSWSSRHWRPSGCTTEGCPLRV